VWHSDLLGPRATSIRAFVPAVPKSPCEVVPQMEGGRGKMLAVRESPGIQNCLSMVQKGMPNLVATVGEFIPKI
jgi:hypothetical protein